MISYSQWVRAVGAEGRDKVRVNRLVLIGLSGGGIWDERIESRVWPWIGLREMGGRVSEDRSLGRLVSAVEIS